MAEEERRDAIVPANGEAADVGAEVARVRGELADIRRALAASTGGAAARTILAELAQELAADLAGSFDELPMHAFSGAVDRERGLLRHVLPRMVTHRVILGRYLASTIPSKAGEGWTKQFVRIAILALGADGVLRRGDWRGFVQLPSGMSPPLDALAWDSLLLRRVPSNLLVLKRWTGTIEARDVAPSGRVLEALTRIASDLAADSRRDLALLQRFL